MRGKWRWLFPIVFFLTLGFSQAWGYSGWETYIPNGNVYSCDNCHLPDSSARTQFGVDFKNNNKTWSSTLADLDSDGDGYTNGEELQDPNGTWVKGQPAPGDPDLVSNPGDRESIPPPPGFSISGNVSGAVSAGVTITLTGAAADTTVTDATGDYIFTGLSNGNYTVTPSKTGYRFRPRKQKVTMSGADVTGVDFVAKVKR
ncbi:MAG: carboxypeptidase-like regulatory domain-containing protein [Proteobacteria bacterium]|nr:carboxypeptidase-like regulatory domain-containing protein [Pseudomonadota bacterium]